MGWFRVSSNLGGSVVVRAANREEAIKQVWNTLEELTRGAVQGLRHGSYMVSEEETVALQEAHHGGYELHALVYLPVSPRPDPGRPLPG